MEELKVCVDFGRYFCIFELIFRLIIQLLKKKNII